MASLQETGRALDPQGWRRRGLCFWKEWSGCPSETTWGQRLPNGLRYYSPRRDPPPDALARRPAPSPGASLSDARQAHESSRPSASPRAALGPSHVLLPDDLFLRHDARFGHPVPSGVKLWTFQMPATAPAETKVHGLALGTDTPIPTKVGQHRGRRYQPPSRSCPRPSGVGDARLRGTWLCEGRQARAPAGLRSLEAGSAVALQGDLQCRYSGMPSGGQISHLTPAHSSWHTCPGALVVAGML